MFFHEDDYCQVQLVPFENHSSLMEEARKVKGFAHSNFDGVAYKDIYVRGDERLKLSDRKIKVSEFEMMLSTSGLGRTDQVTTGYGSSHREVCANTVGYGRSDCAILFDWKNETVEHVWLFFHWGTEGLNKRRLSDLVHKIGQNYNLILMDWNQLILTDIRQKEQADKYLNERE
jgi:hypothetical protein